MLLTLCQKILQCREPSQRPAKRGLDWVAMGQGPGNICLCPQSDVDIHGQGKKSKKGKKGTNGACLRPRRRAKTLESGPADKTK